jgi:hypothetical protein
MTSNEKKDDLFKVEFTSIGAGILAGMSQYKNLSGSKLAGVQKFTVCGLTFLFCYSITRIALKNIHRID